MTKPVMLIVAILLAFGVAALVSRGFRELPTPGSMLMIAGALLVLWLAGNISDPAPSAKYFLMLAVAMIAAGVWVSVRSR